jgi:hypothetical protein
VPASVIWADENAYCAAGRCIRPKTLRAMLKALKGGLHIQNACSTSYAAEKIKPLPNQFPMIGDVNARTN